MLFDISPSSLSCAATTACAFSPFSFCRELNGKHLLRMRVSQPVSKPEGPCSVLREGLAQHTAYTRAESRRMPQSFGKSVALEK